MEWMYSNSDLNRTLIEQLAEWTPDALPSGIHALTAATTLLRTLMPKKTRIYVALQILATIRRYIAEVINYFPAISIGAHLALEYVKTSTYVDPERKYNYG